MGKTTAGQAVVLPILLACDYFFKGTKPIFSTSAWPLADRAKSMNALAMSAG
jgi:hypothetical protein